MTKSSSIRFSWIKRTLDFTFEAGTSRGVLRERTVYWIKAEDLDTGRVGWGEAAPLIHLSPDYLPDFESLLDSFLAKASLLSPSQAPNLILRQVGELIPLRLPSIRFAVESSLLDLHFGGVKKYMDNDFFDRNEPITINGLIWMGDRAAMLEQIERKLMQGFSCIKMKIGAIDFQQELSLLAHIRNRYSASEVTLRVDANGAFSPDEALKKLQQLASFDLHSIEQPIAAGQIEQLKVLCAVTPLPIALDEELIGVQDKTGLLQEIKPQYIILKPSLLGGIAETKAWIETAESLGIGWWMTSALESNIGLNVISQLASSLNCTIPQGLGTGQLYHNNLQSPLHVASGLIQYLPNGKWEEPS